MFNYVVHLHFVIQHVSIVHKELLQRTAEATGNVIGFKGIFEHKPNYWITLNFN